MDFRGGQAIEAPVRRERPRMWMGGRGRSRARSALVTTTGAAPSEVREYFEAALRLDDGIRGQVLLERDRATLLRARRSRAAIATSATC
jgi:hypothetical protein